METHGVRLTWAFLGAVLWALVAAIPAWAVQQHGGAEGLVAHQIGHVLFVMGMTILLLQVYQKKLLAPGWREFKGFLWLIICWNGLTFGGHGLREIMEPHKFVTLNGQVVGFQIENVVDLFFYLSRLDHLLLVPSFLLLLRALVLWRKSA